MGSMAPADILMGPGEDALPALLQAALSARSQLGWSRWLQGGIQAFLPHDALIAAWGDFQVGDLAYDVIARAPGLAMHAWPPDVIEPAAESLFLQWLAAGQEPLAVDTRPLRSIGSALFAGSPCALVHGVQDRRSHYDCIYVFVGPDSLSSPLSRQLCRMALPYIDTAFRQVCDRGQQGVGTDMARGGFTCSRFADGALGQIAAQALPPAPTGGEPHPCTAEAGERGSALSARELEVMQWVRMGKTNPEIAMILNLSMFTVKNHMRRIYRKLDVLNRAQAVGSLDRMQAPQQQAGR